MKVLFCIPTTGWISSDLFMRTQRIFQNAIEKGIQIGVHVVKAIPHDSSRNLLVEGFLENDWDWMLSCDSDVVPPENIVDMITDERPLCAAYVNAVLPMDINKPISERVGPVAIGYEDVPGGIRYFKFPFEVGEVKEVPSFGTGCFAVRRDVFETIPAPHFKFGYNEKGILTLGEDLYFCKKAREHGFIPHMDGRFVCLHLKEIFI